MKFQVTSDQLDQAIAAALNGSKKYSVAVDVSKGYLTIKIKAGNWLYKPTSTLTFSSKRQEDAIVVQLHHTDIALMHQKHEPDIRNYIKQLIKSVGGTPLY